MVYRQKQVGSDIQVGYLLLFKLIFHIEGFGISNQNAAPG